jgi:hypothetical protein
MLVGKGGMRERALQNLGIFEPISDALLQYFDVQWHDKTKNLFLVLFSGGVKAPPEFETAYSVGS